MKSLDSLGNPVRKPIKPVRKESESPCDYKDRLDHYNDCMWGWAICVASQKLEAEMEAAEDEEEFIRFLS